LNIEKIQTESEAIIDEVERVIVGKRETIQQAVLTMLCNGHLLIEDIPGVGKTTLAKALAKAIGGEFRRVQFTPDLLPADVTGSSVYNQKESLFEFRAGPIFGNVILVDEINRATPKTQSALLEAMEERTVTVDGETRQLPRPFFVIATQNSVEMTGTYPLPEAQLDRFFARVSLGYPSRDSEIDILTRQQISHPIDLVQTVTDPTKMMELQNDVRDVFVHDSVREYIVDLVRATRESPHLLMGTSPRGTLHLMRAAQANAAMTGNDYVRPDDVKAVAGSVLAHRVLPRAESRARGETTEGLIAKVVETVRTPVPVS
jgi:MoxR-like ATPase